MVWRLSLNEQYVAGAILIEEYAIMAIDGVITAEDFESEYCRAIFEAAWQLFKEGRAADPAAIAEHARRNGVILQPQYLAELMECVPTAASIFEYAQRVAEEAKTRRVKSLAAQIQMDGTATADELLQKMQKEAGELSKKSARDDEFLDSFKALNQFDEEEATWLVPGWIPEGQITLIAADGGVGKTTLWVDIIAALSAGRRCIFDPVEHVRGPMKIAFCTTEDSVKKKLRKKLREAGANLNNIITMDVSADKSGVLSDFNFGSAKMDQFVRHFKPVACVFDPVQGFVPPKVNMGARNEMRHCMAPLIALGEDIGTTFIVICHTNKRKGAYGRDRIADSADLWDIARSVIMAGYTEDQGVRYLSNEKNNYTQLQETILFSVNTAGQIVHEGASWKRDKEYMMEAVVAKSAPKRDDCKEFILNTLRNSPNQCMRINDLEQKAADRGYSAITFRRSREDLNREGETENYYLGQKGKKGRVAFVRIKQEDAEEEQMLPI